MNVPPIDAIRVPVDDLRDLSVTLFTGVGVPRQDAELIAELLIDTDLRGVLSHGTAAVPGYVRAYMEGKLNPTPQLRVLRDEPTTAIVDGDGGLGHLAAARATELAIAKARQTGLGAAISRHHGHYGGAGKYTRMAARRGCVGFSVSGHVIEAHKSDPPQWNPLGNPPMSFAFPAGDEAPLILDMGTSVFEPEHFPSLYEQAPAAFYKSIGLVAVAQWLGGVMAGMMLPEYSEDRSYDAARYGAFIFVVDIERFVPLEAFEAEVDRSMREVHTLPPLPGCERYDLPGGLEWDRERAWAEEGIPLSPTHQRGLEQIAAELELPIPWQDQS